MLNTKAELVGSAHLEVEEETDDSQFASIIHQGGVLCLSHLIGKRSSSLSVLAHGQGNGPMDLH